MLAETFPSGKSRSLGGSRRCLQRLAVRSSAVHRQHAGGPGHEGGQRQSGAGDARARRQEPGDCRERGVDGGRCPASCSASCRTAGEPASPDYALVHEDDLDAFVAQYDAARALPGGRPAPTTSIVSDRHFDRLKGLDERAQGRARDRVGVNPRRRPPPTRSRPLVGAGDDTTVMQEEIFGPILLRCARIARSTEVVDYVNARHAAARAKRAGQRLRVVLKHHVGQRRHQQHAPSHRAGRLAVRRRRRRDGAYHGIEGFRDEAMRRRVRAGTLEPAETCCVRRSATRGSVRALLGAQPGTGAGVRAGLSAKR